MSVERCGAQKPDGGECLVKVPHGSSRCHIHGGSNGFARRSGWKVNGHELKIEGLSSQVKVFCKKCKKGDFIHSKHLQKMSWEQREKAKKWILGKICLEECE